MADERDKILKFKAEHAKTKEYLAHLEKGFAAFTCRYRNLDSTCGHSRHNMSKFPGQHPTPPPCGPVVCPRN